MKKMHYLAIALLAMVGLLPAQETLPEEPEKILLQRFVGQNFQLDEKMEQGDQLAIDRRDVVDYFPNFNLANGVRLQAKSEGIASFVIRKATGKVREYSIEVVDGNRDYQARLIKRMMKALVKAPDLEVEVYTPTALDYDASQRVSTTEQTGEETSTNRDNSTRNQQRAQNTGSTTQEDQTDSTTSQQEQARRATTRSTTQGEGSSVTGRTAENTNNNSENVEAVNESSAGTTSRNTLTNTSTLRPARLVIVLKGKVPDDLVMNEAMNVAYSMIDPTAGDRVLNFATIDNPLQIRVMVQILSVEMNNDYEIGFEHTSAARTANEVPGLAFSYSLADFATATGFPFFNTNLTSATTLAGGGTAPGISTVLNVAAQDQRIKVLQQPVLTLMNGQSGYFNVGGEFPVITTTVDDGVITESAEYFDTGITVYLTPIMPEDETLRPDADNGGIPSATYTQEHFTKGQAGIATGLTDNRRITTIHKNGLISLRVFPRLRVVSGTLATGIGNSFPIFSTQVLETRVTMRDGESLIMGGLFAENTDETLQKTPFLEKIPIIGELFKNRTKASNREELIFVITPKIVDMRELAKGDIPRPKTKEALELYREEGMMSPTVKPVKISAGAVTPRTAEVLKAPIPEVIFSETSSIPTREEFIIEGADEAVEATDPPIETSPETTETVTPMDTGEETPITIETDAGTAEVSTTPPSEPLISPRAAE